MREAVPTVRAIDHAVAPELRIDANQHSAHGTEKGSHKSLDCPVLLWVVRTRRRVADAQGLQDIGHVAAAKHGLVVTSDEPDDLAI